MWFVAPLFLLLVAMVWYGWYYHFGSASIAAENPGFRGDTFEIRDGLPLSAMAHFSDTIVIGEVGPLQALDYPLKYQFRDLTPAEFADIGGNKAIYSRRDAYYLIHVEEILHGEIATPFVVARPDLSFYTDVITPEFAEGDKVILLTELAEWPEYSTDKFSTFYNTIDYGAVFIIDDENRAFPLIPESFIDTRTFAEKAEYKRLLQSQVPGGPSIASRFVPEELDLILDDGDLEPYIDLDKLRFEIERELEDGANVQPGSSAAG